MNLVFGSVVQAVLLALVRKRQLTQRVCPQAGVSEKKLRHLQLARRAATCMRWETMQGGRGAFEERGSGDEMISDADVMGPGGVASAPERMDEAIERGENTRCACSSCACKCEGFSC